MKKVVVALLTVALLTVGAGSALGAADQAKINELKALHQQMFSIRAQIIDKEVEAGLLDKEKAAKIKSFMEKRRQKVEEALDKGQLPQFGKIRGFGHRRQNPQTVPQTTPSPAAN